MLGLGSLRGPGRPVGATDQGRPAGAQGPGTGRLGGNMAVPTETCPPSDAAHTPAPRRSGLAHWVRQPQYRHLPPGSQEARLAYITMQKVLGLGK